MALLSPLNYALSYSFLFLGTEIDTEMFSCGGVLVPNQAEILVA